MQTKKIFLMLIVFCVIFIFLPVGVWAKYKCTCTSDASENFYDTKEACEEKDSTDDKVGCEEYCLSYGGLKNCSFIDDGTNDYKSAKLDNPLGVSTVPEVISRLIKIMLGLVGTVSLVVFIYAGFLWITAQGKPDMITKGKDAMIWAVVGILVVFTSYAILKYVFDVLSF